MNPHFEERDGVRVFVHGGPAQQPRRLDRSVAQGEELRLVLPRACNVGAGVLQALQGRRYGSAVGRITPTRSFRADTGSFCREFEEEVDLGAGTDRFTDIRCRTDGGRWLRPSE